ncbi:MAG: PIN domain-containing protein, partial [Fretibacterium sp.]|nr:PIN domain-containing protein [Fretibacterium sp.]
MKFYSIRDLRSATKDVCLDVRANGEAVITNNGKPSLLMLDISEDNFEEILRAVRQAKAMIAFNSMREVAAMNGYMSEEDIEAEIQAARGETGRRVLMLAVLDTHVLVSALWTPAGKASAVLNAALAHELRLCHDYRIMSEYREVLTRPKFKFAAWQVNFLLETIEKDGVSVIPALLPGV